MKFLLGPIQYLLRRWPAAVAVGIVVLTIVFGSLTTLAEQEQGFQNFLPDNEISVAQDRIAEEFESEETATMQVGVYAPPGGDVLSAEGIRVAQEVIERVRDDEALADELAKPGPERSAIVTWADLVLQSAAASDLDPAELDDAQVDELQAAALAEVPRAQRGLLTATLGGERSEGSATAGLVILFLEPDAISMSGDTPAQAALSDLRTDIDGFEVRPFDIAAMSSEISDAITGQLSGLLLLAVGLIILILVAIYRRVVDVLASLLGLGFTIVWMQGISALLGPGGLGWTGGQSEMAMAIPILLVGLGVDYGIHLTMRYREERAGGDGPVAAATGAVGAVGTALVLATMTTVVGFLTNLSNPLPPLQDFGVFAAVGVASAFVIMVAFVPAVRLLVDRWRQRRDRLPAERSHSTDPGLLGRGAAAVAPLAVRRPWVVLGVAVLLSVAGGLGATQLSTEFSQTEFFPTDSEALATIERTQEAFQGDVTETTQVLVTGDLARPAALNAIAEFQDGVADNAQVRDDVLVDSVVTRLSSIQESMDEAMAGGEAPEMPEDVDPAVVERLATTLLGSGFGTEEGVSGFTDVATLYDDLMALDPSVNGLLSGDGEGGYDAALVDVPTSAGEEVEQLRDQLRADAEVLHDAGLDYVLVSEGLLVDLVMGELQSSQLTGLALTLVASMAILALAFWARERKPMLGVMAILAVGLVVSWVLGLMATIGIPFNVMTAMVSALAIGIGVPFGIHVVNRFLEDRKTHDTPLAAMTDTLRNTGGALVGSAVTTMAGFGVLAFSSISPFRQFGIVLALTIGLALLASIIVLPAMLALWARRHDWDDDPVNVAVPVETRPRVRA